MYVDLSHVACVFRQWNAHCYNVQSTVEQARVSRRVKTQEMRGSLCSADLRRITLAERLLVESPENQID